MKRSLPLLLALLLASCAQAPAATTPAAVTTSTNAATTTKVEPLEAPELTGEKAVAFQKITFQIPADLEKSFDADEYTQGEGVDSTWGLMLGDFTNNEPLARIQFMLSRVEDPADTRANNDKLMADDATVLNHLTSANVTIDARIVDYGKRQIAGQYEGWYYDFWQSVNGAPETHCGRVTFLVGDELYWIEYGAEPLGDNLWPMLEAIIDSIQPA